MKIKSIDVLVDCISVKNIERPLIDIRGNQLNTKIYM